MMARPALSRRLGASHQAQGRHRPPPFPRRRRAVGGGRGPALPGGGSGALGGGKEAGGGAASRPFRVYRPAPRLGCGDMDGRSTLAALRGLARDR